MKTVLFAWELGGGLGHLYQVAPLARELARRGYRLAFALKDLAQARPLLGASPAELWQAPLWTAGAHGDLRPVNYAEMLMQFGYLEPAGLAGLVEAWRNLYRRVAPDLLVVNHAPTALLAASGLPIPKVIVDMGFSLPPKLVPMPPMRWWAPADEARLRRSEARVLGTINTLARAFRFPERVSLSELFDADDSFLCTYPELDQYPMREAGARFHGPLFTQDAGQRPAWPSGAGPRIFAYLDLPNAPAAAALGAFGSLDARTVVYTPRFSSGLGTALNASRVHLVGEPVRVASALAEADVVICHGSGLSAAALLAGKPVLLVSRNLEQHMVGMRIKQLGAGDLLPASDVVDRFDVTVQALVSEPHYVASAKRFAARYAGFSQEVQVAEMRARCEALLGEGIAGASPTVCMQSS